MLQDRYTVSHGSGIFPHNQSSPSVRSFGNIPEGTYPVASKGDARTRFGEGVILLNPEDLSIGLGLRSSSVVVGTSPVALPSVPLEYRRSLSICNPVGNATIYIGSSSVSASTGFPILAGEKLSIDILGQINTYVYAISETGGQDVRILELA